MVASPPDAPAVREAVESDRDAFAEFCWAAWRQAGPDAPGLAGATEEDIVELTSPAAFAERIGGPDRWMFLAWEGSRVVGFAATRRHDDATVELAGIIVLASSGGTGVGTALVDAAIEKGREGSHQSMIVRTETTNHAARSFYEARGFTYIRTTVEQVGDVPVEVWELSRPL